MNKMTTLTHRSIVRDGVFGKAYQTAVPNIAVAPGRKRELTPSETLYTDSIDYLLGGALTLRNGRIDKYQFDEGYCQAETYTSTKDNFTFCYYSKDHLGNVRSVVTKSTFTNAVTEEQKTHYYPFGGIIADLSTGRSVQNRLYNGKELDTSNNLWWYDYGARQYDPTAPRFTTADPLAEKYYGWNMYGYCVNNPVIYVDPNGMDIYMLFYVTGNINPDDDSMFKACAETRKKDIEGSTGFNNQDDIVVLKAIQDLGNIGNEVSNIVKEYSSNYGKTAEFGLWSHNGYQDGPIGTTPTSSDALGGKQMTINGWSKIDFNWSNNASASFYGCNSGHKQEDRASFTTLLSSKKNFRNVVVYGQTNYSYPSTSSRSRKTSTAMLFGHFSVPTYMVGGDRGHGREAYFGGAPISPMRRSINGNGK